MTTGRTGRRPGGFDTRATILEQARTLFAERGYTGTSVRAIAAAAGVDAALVHRFFGSKEQLFRASLELPVDPAAEIREIAAAGPDDVPLRLVRAILDLWDAPDSGPAMAASMRRLLAEPEPSDALRDFVDESALRTAATTLLAGVAPDEAGRRMSLALSQLFGLVIVRRLLALEPLASWPADDLAAAVAPTIERYLRGEHAAPIDLTDIPAPSATENEGHAHD